MSDLEIMKRVLELAREAEGMTSPNPMVGAVITKGNKVIGEGFHKKAGLPHAEIEAINSVKGSLDGAKLYVNLEPCCFWGKTPPCVDRIISSGIKEVVFSTLDPNPKVNGKSLIKLKKHSIKVKTGLLKEEAEKLNEVFFKNMREKRPFIALKAAESLDGKIATGKGESMWITSLKARRYAKKLRDKYDAVLIGINTVIEDNPHLRGIKKDSYKVIFDPSLKIPIRCNLVNDSAKKLIIFSTNPNSERKVKILKNKGVRIFNVASGQNGLLLRKIVDALYNIGITSIYVEGGSFTLGTFFDAKLVDKIYFFIAPMIIGGSKALTSIGAKGVLHLDKAAILKDLNIKNIERDLLIEGYPEFSKLR